LSTTDLDALINKRHSKISDPSPPVSSSLAEFPPGLKYLSSKTSFSMSPPSLASAGRDLLSLGTLLSL
jgi:hypothetical protein